MQKNDNINSKKRLVGTFKETIVINDYISGKCRLYKDDIHVGNVVFVSKKK